MEISWQLGVTIEEVERQVIEKCFALLQGNKTKTAQALGISIRTIDNKLAKYKLDDEKKNAAISKRS